MPGSDVFRPSYSQSLRVIGQFLESVKPTEFDLRLRENTIALQYKAVEAVQTPAPKSRFSFLSGTPQVKTQKVDGSREYSTEEQRREAGCFARRMQWGLHHGSLCLRPGRQCRLRLRHHEGECLGLGDGKIRQHLAVEFDARGLQPTHER